MLIVFRLNLDSAGSTQEATLSSAGAATVAWGGVQVIGATFTSSTRGAFEPEAFENTAFNVSEATVRFIGSSVSNFATAVLTTTLGGFDPASFENTAFAIPYAVGATATFSSATLFSAALSAAGSTTTAFLAPEGDAQLIAIGTSSVAFGGASIAAASLAAAGSAEVAFTYTTPSAAVESTGGGGGYGGWRYRPRTYPRLVPQYVDRPNLTMQEERRAALKRMDRLIDETIAKLEGRAEAADVEIAPAFEQRVETARGAVAAVAQQPQIARLDLAKLRAEIARLEAQARAIEAEIERLELEDEEEAIMMLAA